MLDFSWLEMSGGSVGSDLLAATASEVYLFGGSIGANLRSENSGSIDWSGGSVGSDVVADDNAVIRIYGTGFTVDTVPVPYGALAAAEGTLRGNLNDGTAIEVPFYHAGAFWSGNAVTGTIELVSGTPVQSPAPDISDQIVLLNDGVIHNVDDDAFDLPLGVRLRSPETPTTLNVLPGAEIGHPIVTSGDSQLNISGGDIGFRESSCCAVLNLNGQTEFMMTDGVIHGWSYIGHQVTAEISGGTLIGEIWLDSDAQLVFEDGFLHGELLVADHSHLEMEGGLVSDDLRVIGTAAVRGGEFFGDFIAEFEGEIQIVGSDFQLWGEPIGYGDLVPLSGSLTGVLENGDPLNIYFIRNQLVVSESETLEGRITLLPEPAQTLMLMAGIGFLIALARRRRSGADAHGYSPRVRVLRKDALIG
jgi:hypothetical protein